MIDTGYGVAQVYSNQYKNFIPHANVVIGSETKTLSFPAQRVYLTYTAPTPSGTIHNYNNGYAAYLYSQKSVSSSYGGRAVWRWSDDGGVPTDVAKDWGWTHMYAYERETWYDQGYHHWYACTG